MSRIILLLDDRADFQAERSTAQIARGVGQDFVTEVQRIGPGRTYFNPVDAVLRLRRTVRDGVMIHAFGATALTVAAMSGPSRILFTPPPEMKLSTIRWLRAVMGYRDVQVICPTSTQRRQCVERGVPLERCHLIRPGVDFARIQRRRNDEFRAALGFAKDDFVMLAAGESTRSADHRATAWTASILHTLDPRYKMLLWGRGEMAGSVQRFGTALSHPQLIHNAESRLKRPVEFEELLCATDLVLVSASGPVATLPISICMAAALPIVSTVTPTVAELLEDRHTAVMSPPESPRALAQRVLELRIDANLQWSISDMARTEAYEYFALTRFINQHRTAYRQFAAGEKIEIQEQAPGAGLRFHGRG